MTYCKHSNQEKFPFVLPDLPYGKEDLAPHFTPETFDYHHGKHHNTYVVNLNKLLEDNQEMMGKSLEQVVQLSKNTNAAIFNNAAQIWNHTFFWNSMSPNGGGKPSGDMLAQIEKDFGSYEKFAEEFKQAALTQFGSGWAWLVYHNNKLQVMKTANAETPISEGIHPILNCDVWEHAYYIDFRNARPNYVDAFLEHMANWEFAEAHMKKVKG